MGGLIGWLWRNRVVRVGAAALAIVLAAGAFAYRYATRDIDYAEKCAAGQCWGYELLQQVVGDEITMRFWGTWGLELRYRVPPGRIERAADNRWLAVDRAILIDLRWRPVDKPDAKPLAIHVIYDFQRGEASVWSPMPLWRMGDYRSDKPEKNWMDETQFGALKGSIEP
jgi:hypothetical protein